MASHSTAILFFSRLPSEEAAYKKLSPDKRKDEVLFSYLYTRTLSIIRETRLPVIFSTEDGQCGDSFAERFVNAINLVFGRGYEGIIVIGNDCPNLQKRHILETYQQLSNGVDVIAGRDKRGGLFLLGLNNKVFNSDQFLKFSWQTRSLYNQIAGIGISCNFYRLRDVLSDINTLAESFVEICEHRSSIKWRRLFFQLYPIFYKFLHVFMQSVKQIFLAVQLPLRAPPLQLF